MSGRRLCEGFEQSSSEYYNIFKVVLTLVPLEGCGNGPSGFSDGLCEVEAFLTQKKRKKAVESGVDWFEERCGLKEIIWQ